MPTGDDLLTNAVLEELIAIKTLLVLALTEGLEKKISQPKVARALGVNQGTVSRMVNPPQQRRARLGPKALRSRSAKRN